MDTTLYPEDIAALHRVYLAARALMLEGGWKADQAGALSRLESAVLDAEALLPYEMKGPAVGAVRD